MRIASFNVENFFGRAKALNTKSWAQGRPVLAAQAELNTVLNQDTYSPAAGSASSPCWVFWDLPIPTALIGMGWAAASGPIAGHRRLRDVGFAQACGARAVIHDPVGFGPALR